MPTPPFPVPAPAPRPLLVALMPLALALPLTAGAADPAPAPWPPTRQATPAAQPIRSYRIAAGPLDEALTRFARQAGITLSFTPELVAGLRSRGLEGRHSVESGLAGLLDGTGRGTRALTPQHYVLQPAAPLPPPAARAGVADAPGPLEPVASAALPQLTVRAQRDRRQDAYDTPAAVATVTREDIDKLPPRNTSDVLGEVAGAYTSQGRQSPGVSVNLRGMQDFGRVNVMIDGTRQNFQRSGHGSNGAVYLDPELLGGVDIAKGPSSTVGGAGMIAGSVNFRTLEADDLISPRAARATASTPAAAAMPTTFPAAWPAPGGWGKTARCWPPWAARRWTSSTGAAATTSQCCPACRPPR